MPDKFLSEFKPFSLTDNFLEKYKEVTPPFGFNGLGYFTYMRTYSRLKNDGTNEQWWETVARVVNGTYNMQKKWIIGNRLEWNEWKAQSSAQEMFDRMFHMKFLPPGRGLWAMGTLITEEKGLYAALNNCSFISTKDIKRDLSKPFIFLMDMSMLGVGVGFDMKGAGQLVVKGVNKEKEVQTYVIPDTREGWVESVRLLIDSYFIGSCEHSFDYSEIREAGLPIKGFGGICAGHKPLEELHKNIRNVLGKIIGKEITVRAIVDIFNYIGKAVVAGNIRRCLPLFYEVLTEKGFKKIKELTQEDRVWTASGYKKVLNVFNTGKQKVLKIKTLNNTEYKSTENHIFLVYNQQNGFMWKKIKDINPETDFLVKPKK